VIETQSLAKTYGRGMYALRDLNLKIEKGEFAFLTGPSGAGKSTLLRLLLLEERPSEGEISVGGRNLSHLTRDEVQAYRRTVGFVFPDFQVIAAKTVFENVSGAEVGWVAAPAECPAPGAVRRRAAAGGNRPGTRQ
jgi:cell division transport system ATP-binding protein